MAISRMNMERQMRNMGGIMGLEDQRQGYFLGKLVKKITKPIKKIVKSPLGKLALLGLGAYGLGGAKFLGGKGIFAGGQGLARFRNLASPFLSGGKLSTIGDIFRVGGEAGKDFSALRLLGGGLGAAAIAAPFFMGGDEEEVEEETPFTETPSSIANIVEQARNRDPSLRFLPEPQFVRNFYRKADGGIIDVPRMPMQEGGIMDLGGMEKDYRTGGFVELGAEERADDVPARLSKNEFVFTADAVRNAGGGDIDKGAEVMQNMMDNLEAGGTISEESQGMNPAQEMFDQAQMMESRIA